MKTMNDFEKQKFEIDFKCDNCEYFWLGSDVIELIRRPEFAPFVELLANECKNLLKSTDELYQEAKDLGIGWHQVQTVLYIFYKHPESEESLDYKVPIVGSFDETFRKVISEAIENIKKPYVRLGGIGFTVDDSKSK